MLTCLCICLLVCLSVFRSTNLYAFFLFTFLSIWIFLSTNLPVFWPTRFNDTCLAYCKSIFFVSNCQSCLSLLPAFLVIISLSYRLPLISAPGPSFLFSKKFPQDIFIIWQNNRWERIHNSFFAVIKYHTQAVFPKNF
jgi:hypothetical protein